MTQQPPFTPAGAQLKMNELYALSSGELTAQANAVLTNFKGWVKTNFALTATQQTYLDGMVEPFASGLSKKINIALSNKLPVKVVLIGNPSEASKYMTTRDTIQFDYYQHHFSVTGSLVIEIGARQ